MRIVMQCGSRVGEVMDFPPHEARAMLADRRARPVDEGGDVAVLAPVAVASDRMADAVVRDPVSRPTVGRRRRR